MAKKSSAKTSQEQPTFEQAILELEQITRALEGGGLTLDDSINAYERGVALKKICQSKLNEAEKKLEYLERKDNGSLEKVAIEDNEIQNGTTDQTRLFQDQ